MFRKLALFEFGPKGRDLGLLLMRIIVGVSIFLKHGWEKVATYSAVYDRLVQNGHYVHMVGVGASLNIATISDAVLTMFIVLGFLTRWSSIYVFFNLLFAWGATLQFAYFSAGPDRAGNATHGEVIVAYLATLLGLFFVGGGRYSIDGLLKKEKARDLVAA